MLGLTFASCLACGTLLYAIRPRIIDDPAVANEVAKGILTFVPAPGYEAQGVIDWNIYSLLSLRGVYFDRHGSDGEGMLLLLEVGTSRLQSYEDVRKHIERTLLEKNGISDSMIVDPQKEKLTVEVQGRQRNFTITKARDISTEAPYRLLEGTVDGPAGPVLIGMRVAESAWNLDAIEEMLKSIQ
jgi:hypothetical protein